LYVINIGTGLQAWGMSELEVECLDDGQKGLDRALLGGFDVIKLDRMMPGMDGIEVIKQLRASGVHTPVILVSALSCMEPCRI
jgi:two-component system OmpR family response regulator